MADKLSDISNMCKTKYPLNSFLDVQIAYFVGLSEIDHLFTRHLPVARQCAKLWEYRGGNTTFGFREFRF